MTDENRTQEQSREAGEQVPGSPRPVGPTAEQAEIARVTAELQQALAEAQEQAKAQTARIRELEAALEAARQQAKEQEVIKDDALRQASLIGREVEVKIADIEDLRARHRAVQEEYGRAVAALVEMHRAANPDIPAELITGSTVAEVAGSVTRARELVNRVRELAREKASQEAEAARVPAGAPGRQPPGLDGLSPRDKIALGVGKARKG